MKRLKRLICIFIVLILAMPVTAQEQIPEKRDLTKRTGYLPPEVTCLTEEDEPKEYTFDRRIFGSSAYPTGINREWAEYSSYYYYNQLTEEERDFYDALMEECLIYLTGGGEIERYGGGYRLPGVSFGNLDPDRAMDVYYYFFRNSNPQFYFLNNEYSYNGYSVLPGVYEAFASESD